MFKNIFTHAPDTGGYVLFYIACRLLEVLDEFMSKVNWLWIHESNISFTRSNFELYTKLRSWKEHDRGMTYFPQVGRCHN